MADEQFSFVITDELGTVVSEGTNDANGNITFNRRLAFHEAGEYVYYVTEKALNMSDILWDTTQYRVTVTVKKSDKLTTVGGVDIYVNYINNIKIDKSADGKTWTEVSNKEYKNDYVSKALSVELTDSDTFVNREVKETSITVVKKWADGNENHGDVTVKLFQNGQLYATGQLNHGHNWTYAWDNLPIKDKDGNLYTYEVKEESVNGYVASYDYQNNVGTVKTYWIPATSIEVEKEYLITTAGGSYALNKSNSDTNDYVLRSIEDRKDISNAKGTGSLTINGKTYEEANWYEDNDAISGTSIFVARSNGGRTILKNKSANSWLLAEERDNTFLKFSSSSTFCSNAEVDASDGRLYLGKGWDKPTGDNYNANKRKVVYDRDKKRFNTIDKTENVDGTRMEYARLFTKVRVFGNDTSATVTITNTPVKEIDYTFVLNKVAKAAEGETGRVLPGAEFQILDVNNNPVKVIQNSSTYKVAGEEVENITETLVTDAKGHIMVIGLKGGDYTVKETKAPEGYGLMEDEQIRLDEKCPDARLEVKYEDPILSYELPETGGIGTTLFCVVGTILMIGAGVLLVARKRIPNNGIM